ncbi:MAG: metallophosphoesterase [Patescibacteria group bacterium]
MNFKIQIVIVFIIYLLLITLFAGAILLFKSKKLKSIHRYIISGILLACCLMLVNSIWFERYFIQTNYHQILDTNINTKIALIADIHAGGWKSKSFVEQIVVKLNQIPDLDIVLMAGDWTYYPDKNQLENIFSPLKDLEVPIYGVLGNHDVEFPGKPIRKELTETLLKNNVKLIDNEVVKTKGITLVGLGSYWANEDKTDILENIDLSEFTIILAHNPDTTLNYSQNFRSNVKNAKAKVLTLSGHTHCGQIRIPYIYKTQLPVVDKYYDKGWYADLKGVGFFDKVDNGNGSIQSGKLFITCGVGEVALPLRFLNPAVIDIFEL